MEKRILIASLIILLGLVLMFGFIVAEGGPSELSEEAEDISTSNGVLDLPEGTLIGGNPTNYITLSEGTTLETTAGSEYFASGTKIDCDVPPGEPNPCDPYA